MKNQRGTLEGGCSCGHIRYRLQGSPLIVHCCHCSWCQRQNGSAFAVNALFKASQVEILQGEPNRIAMPSPSGNGQKIARCPKCEVAVWSNYFMGGIKEGIRFIRAGTLDDPSSVPPDVHIFTVSKQPWVTLSDAKPAVDIFYDYEDLWSPEDNEWRLNKLKTSDTRPFGNQLK